MKALADQITPRMIAEAIAEGLGAETVTKRGAEPNWSAKLQACSILLSYFEGKPTRRVELVEAPETASDESALARLLESPAARAYLQKALDSLDAQAPVGF